MARSAKSGGNRMGGAARAFGGASGNAIDSPQNRRAGAGNSTPRGVSSASPRQILQGKAQAPGAVGQRPNPSHSGLPGGGSHHQLAKTQQSGRSLGLSSKLTGVTGKPGNARVAMPQHTSVRGTMGKRTSPITPQNTAPAGGRMFSPGSGAKRGGKRGR